MAENRTKQLDLNAINKFLNNFTNYGLVGYTDKIIKKKYKLSILLAKNKEYLFNVGFIVNGDISVSGDDKTYNFAQKTNKIYYFIIRINIRDLNNYLKREKRFGLEYNFKINDNKYIYLLYKINSDIVGTSNSEIKNIFSYLNKACGIEYDIIYNQYKPIPLPYTNIVDVDVNGIVELEEGGNKEIDGFITEKFKNILEELTQRQKVVLELFKQVGKEFVSGIKKIKLSDILSYIEGKEIKKIDNETYEFDGVVSYYNYKTKTFIYTDEYKNIKKAGMGSHLILLYRAANYNFITLGKIIQKNKELYNLYISQSGEVEELVINCIDYSLIFTNRNVYLQQNGTSAYKVLFRENIKLIGKGYGSLNIAGFEIKEQTKILVIEVKGKKIVLGRVEVKNKFNKIYGKDLFFYGGDNDLGMFFDGIEKFGNLEDIQVYNKNGYFNKLVILGGEVIYGKKGKNDIVDVLQTFQLHKGEQIKAKDALDMLREIYLDEMIVPIFLESLALAGMNLRKNKEIYPGLLLTGETGSGKTGISMIMKTLLGYGKEARKRALPALTPQPLSVLLNDNSILFLEELTKTIGIKQEEMLRNVINHDEGGRGMLGSNVVYSNTSPLFITGERTFKDRSLNNRFVIVTVDKKFWKLKGQDGKEALTNMFNYSITNDVYGKYLSKQDKINEIHSEYAKKLSRQLDSRFSDVRAYVFAANEIMELGFEELTLLQIASNNLANMGSLIKGGNKGALVKLKNLLLKGILTRKIFIDIDDDENFDTTKHEYSFIFVDDEYFEKYKGKLSFLVNEVIEEHDVYDKIILDDSSITFTIDEVNASDFDKTLQSLVFKSLRLKR